MNNVDKNNVPFNRLVDADNLGNLQLHLAEAVKKMPYTQPEIDFLKELRSEINQDFLNGNYEYSGTQGINKDYFQSSIQFKLNGPTIVKYIRNLYLTAAEINGFLKKATANGDLINTQGLYNGDDAYFEVRFQDPRQHNLINEAYIGFDFNYVPTPDYESKLHNLKDDLKGLTEDVTTNIDELKKSIADIISKIESTTTTTQALTSTTTSTKAPENTTTTSTSKAPEASTTIAPVKDATTTTSVESDKEVPSTDEEVKPDEETK